MKSQRSVWKRLLSHRQEHRLLQSLIPTPSLLSSISSPPQLLPAAVCCGGHAARWWWYVLTVERCREGLINIDDAIVKQRLYTNIIINTKKIKKKKSNKEATAATTKKNNFLSNGLQKKAKTKKRFSMERAFMIVKSKPTLQFLRELFSFVI